MIKLDITQTASPICPYCEMEINTVSAQKVNHLLGKTYLYFCPHCRKVLGFGHRKGFWMG